MFKKKKFLISLKRPGIMCGNLAVLALFAPGQRSHLLLWNQPLGRSCWGRSASQRLSQGISLEFAMLDAAMAFQLTSTLFYLAPLDMMEPMSIPLMLNSSEPASVQISVSVPNLLTCDQLINSAYILNYQPKHKGTQFFHNWYSTIFTVLSIFCHFRNVQLTPSKYRSQISLSLVQTDLVKDSEGFSDLLFTVCIFHLPGHHGQELWEVNCTVAFKKGEKGENAVNKKLSGHIINIWLDIYQRQNISNNLP